MRKSVLLLVSIALLLTGCAHRQAESVSGYGGYYLGDCIYPDICGPGLYGTYFYYTPLFPSGPLSPERMRVDRIATHRLPRIVRPHGISQDSGHYSPSASSGSSSPSAPAAAAPVAPPAPPPVHTVGPRG